MCFFPKSFCLEFTVTLDQVRQTYYYYFATRPFETSLGYWKILTCNPELACYVFTYLKLNSLHTLHCFLYFLKKLPILPVLGKERKKKAQVLKSKSLLKKTLSTTLAIINPFLISAVWKKTISVLLKEAHLRSPPPLPLIWITIKETFLKVCGLAHASESFAKVTCIGSDTHGSK